MNQILPLFRIVVTRNFPSDSGPSCHWTTSFLTATAFAYANGAGITAAAGTRLALHLILIDRFGYHPSQIPTRVKLKRSCYFSSLPHQCWYWAICAPAAILRRGSRFSGSLSGIKPWFPVTRESHGSPIHYRLELIGQKPVRCCAESSPVRYCIHSRPWVISIHAAPKRRPNRGRWTLCRVTACLPSNQGFPIKLERGGIVQTRISPAVSGVIRLVGNGYPTSPRRLLLI